MLLGFFRLIVTPGSDFLFVEADSSNLMFLNCVQTGRFPNTEAHFLYYRTHADADWTEINLPRHSLGSSRRIWLSFDFGRAERIWITVNGDDYLYRNLPEEYYYSDDLGVRWSQITTAYPALIGMSTRDWGIGDTSSTSKELVFRNTFSNESTILDWSVRIRQQLWPNSDTANIKIDCGKGPSSTDNNPQSFAVNPANPNFICLRITADTMIDKTWFERSAFVVTNDNGVSWFLIKVGTPRFSIDTTETWSPGPCVSPWNNQVFIPYRKYDRPPGTLSSTNRESGLIRYTLSSSTVVLDDRIKKHNSVWPNPANDYVKVFVDSSTKVVAVRIVDLLGKELTSARSADGLEHEILLSTKSLPSGTHYLHLEGESGVRSFPVIIIH